MRHTLCSIDQTIPVQQGFVIMLETIRGGAKIKKQEQLMQMRVWKG